MNATTRAAGEGLRLDDADLPVPHAPAGGQDDVVGLPHLTAVITFAGLAHGWALLLLLEIARE